MVFIVHKLCFIVLVKNKLHRVLFKVIKATLFLNQVILIKKGKFCYEIIL